MHIATGIFCFSPIAEAWSAACLWICQCNPISVSLNTCALYIPRLCSPFSGFLVTTSGSVTKCPPSIGQVLGIGSLVKSKSIFTR